MVKYRRVHISLNTSFCADVTTPKSVHTIRRPAPTSWRQKACTPHVVLCWRHDANSTYSVTAGGGGGWSIRYLAWRLIHAEVSIPNGSLIRRRPLPMMPVRLDRLPLAFAVSWTSPHPIGARQWLSHTSAALNSVARQHSLLDVRAVLSLRCA